MGAHVAFAAPRLAGYPCSDQSCALDYAGRVLQPASAIFDRDPFSEVSGFVTIRMNKVGGESPTFFEIEVPLVILADRRDTRAPAETDTFQRGKVGSQATPRRRSVQICGMGALAIVRMVSCLE